MRVYKAFSVSGVLVGLWWVFGGSLVGRFGGSLVGLWWVFGGGTKDPPKTHQTPTKDAPKTHRRPTKDPPKIQHMKNEENIDFYLTSLLGAVAGSQLCCAVG